MLTSSNDSVNVGVEEYFGYHPVDKAFQRALSVSVF